MSSVPKDSIASAIIDHYSPTLQDLISLPTIQKLERITRFLPRSITSLWGYELPLHQSEKSSDFLICIHKSELFSRAFEAHRKLEPVIARPFYDRFSELARRWADPEDKVGQLISNIWLEYDYEEFLTDHPGPNFFYGPKNNLNPLETAWLSRHVFDLLAPEGLPRGTFPFLIRCISLLEGHGLITQIGRMLARNENSLRLFVQRIPQNGILPYLRKIGYPDAENPALANQLERCYRLADTVDLDIDITDRIGSQLGLECYFDTTEKALLFLDDLVESGICIPEKQHLLRNHLLQIRSSPDEQLLHRFSHFKLGFHPAKGFASKGYIGYADREIAAGVVRTQPIRVE